MSILMVKCPDGVNRPVSEDHPLPVVISTGTNPSAQTQAGGSGLAIPAHDFADLSYTGGNLTSVAYKKGGADAGTMTLTYTADGRLDTYSMLLVAPIVAPVTVPTPHATTTTGGAAPAGGTSHQTRSLDAWHPPTPYDFFASVRSTNYGDLDDSVADASADPSGTGSFASPVLLPDGRVLCLPVGIGNTLAKIYDPKTSLWVNCSGVFPEGIVIGGGAALLQDSRVFLLPWNGGGVAIYDPVADTLTKSAATIPHPHLFSGAVVLQDGRVFCVPTKSATALIYDPVKDRLITPSGAYPVSAGYSFAGGVLMGDGRVFCVPGDSTVAAIYDPVGDSVTTTPANSFPGGFAYRSGVLLTDGRVLCVPSSATIAKIYDPTTGGVTNQTASFSGGGAFTCGVLLPNGKVFLAPNNLGKGGIYDPVADVLTLTASTIRQAVAPVLMVDGRIFCLAGGSSPSQIYGNPLPHPLPLARVLSAYDNHR